MKFLIPSILAFFLISCCNLSQEPDFAWTLPGADFDCRDYPVSIALPGDVEPDRGNPVLVEIVGGKQVNVPCQIHYDEEIEISWIVDGITKAGQERQYELRFGARKSEIPEIKVEKNDSTLFLSRGDQPILHYRYKEMPAPAGQSYLFARSGFIHPLYSPSGEVLSWAQPPDHIHHVGLWNPWTKVTWKENHTDFWNLGSGQGTVRFKDVLATEDGPVYAEFRVLQDHIAFVPPKSPNNEDEYTGDEIKVMEEEWVIRVWDMEDGYLLDFTSLIRNLMDETISLDAYRYGGGLGYRATSKWNKDNSIVLTSEGKTRENGDATRAKWAWISGDLEGKNTGLLFMSDPDNYDFPQPMRIWPDNSNGVGHQYFEFTPIRENAWVLEPGKTYSQKYRIWVQEGPVDPEHAEQQWQQYAKGLDQKISYLSN